MFHAALLSMVNGFAARLRFPYLLALTATLFLLDVIIPDLVPFADEVLLGLATLLFASWKKRDPDVPAAGRDAGRAGSDSSSRKVIDVSPADPRE